MSETTVPLRRPLRLWQLAFFLSLAVNLGVAGLVVGSMVSPRGERPGPGRDLGLGAFTEVMTPVQRDRLRQVFKGQDPDFRAMRRQMRAERAALFAALRTEPFDGEAFGRAMDEMSARHGERMRHGEGLLRQVITEMSTEERLAFAARLQTYMDLPRKGGDRSGDR